MVLSYQKISDTQGNFTAPIDDGDELGGATAGLGDLDGGGPSVRAMAVGAAFDDDAGTDAGAVYIMFLASNGAVLSYQKINGASLPGQLGAGDEFGSALAFLGDLDGAGPSVGALAVGATGDDDGGSNRGAVYILFLSSSGTVLSYQKISDTQGNFLAPMLDSDEIGAAVAYLGDLDGAGSSVAALAAGATGDNDGGADQGAVYILFLASNGTVLSYQKISETAGGFPAVLESGDDFGGALAALGDLDEAGPSVAALAVGAALDETPPALPDANRGAVYILFLASNGTVLSNQKLTNTDFPADGDQFGDAVANVGDLDGSGAGVRSLAVGVTGDDDGGTDKGAVYVLSLSATATVLAFQKISDFYGGFTATFHPVDNLGSSLAALGDLDGAGPSVAAMAVGATGDDDGNTGNPLANRGAVYIMFLDGNSVAGVSGPPAVSSAFLGRARPNPFRPSTTIPFRLAQSALVQIDVLDVSGRLVRQLFREHAGPGEHSAVWDGRDDSGGALAPGTYFYRMSVDGRVTATAEKALLLR